MPPWCATSPSSTVPQCSSWNARAMKSRPCGHSLWRHSCSSGRHRCSSQCNNSHSNSGCPHLPASRGGGRPRLQSPRLHCLLQGAQCKGRRLSTMHLQQLLLGVQVEAAGGAKRGRPHHQCHPHPMGGGLGMRVSRRGGVLAAAGRPWKATTITAPAAGAASRGRRSSVGREGQDQGLLRPWARGSLRGRKTAVALAANQLMVVVRP